jgi:predicted CoA-substrate-specific enzyme activase
MFVGVDIGSLTTKAVLFDHRQIISYKVVDSRSEHRQAGEDALNEALENAQVTFARVKYVVSTGYGRKLVACAHKTVTELTCHARGAHWLDPRVRTVIDIGGQDSKVISVDQDGSMVDFVMNDKCAAGTGRFLEVMAQALGFDITSLGEVSLLSDQPCSLSSICTVFAESEVISLLSSGAKKNDIIAGLHHSIAQRIGNMVRKLGVRREIAFTGGVAKNEGVARALEEFLGVSFLDLSIDPQIVGALGAALVGRDIWSATGS